MAWVRRNAPVVLLGIGLLGSVVLILRLTRDFTFLQDTWDFLIDRRDPTVDALLNPHNEHIVVIPVAIEELLLRLFGMGDATPEYVLQALFLAAAAALLFVYVRRRVGDWPALFAALLVLFLGPAWEVLLWPFEISFSGSVLFGLAMLLALDREDQTGDIAACAFLALCFGFSSLGIAFAVGAAVDVFVKRRRRGLGRAYLFALPLLLYAGWYMGWGHKAETHLALRNLMTSPRFVVDSIAVAVASLFGLAESPLAGPIEPSWGRPLLIALVAALVYRLWRRRGVFSPAFWTVATVAATNWFLTAFNATAGRAPVSSRYQYMSAVMILLLLANLLQGERFTRRALAVAGVVTAMAVSVNLIYLKDGRDTLMVQSVYTRSDLGAIEISKRTIDPGFWLNSVVAGTPTLVNVQTGQYLAAVDAYGSPADTPVELAAEPAYARKQADIILGQALPLSTLTHLGAYEAGAAERSCTVLPAGSATPQSELRVAAGLTRIELAPGPHARFSLRRFATGEYPVVTEGAPGNSVTDLRIPRDAAPQPWYLHVDAAQEIRICR